MASIFTIRGYGAGFTTPETRFTGSRSEACHIADEFARTYGDQLRAVVVTGPDPEDVVYVTHGEGEPGGFEPAPL